LIWFRFDWGLSPVFLGRRDFPHQGMAGMEQAVPIRIQAGGETMSCRSTLIGFVGQDPSMSYTPDGTPVTNFSVVTRQASS
jgi:hypothetical protein